MAEINPKIIETLRSDEARQGLLEGVKPKISAEQFMIFEFLVTYFGVMFSNLQTFRAQIRKLLKMLFGPKSDGPRDKSPGSEPKYKGKKGRTHAEDHPGAKLVPVPHPHLCKGDLCPICERGRLKQKDPKEVQVFDGGPAFELTIYLLERLQCSACKKVFVAPMPGSLNKPFGPEPKSPTPVVDPTEAPISPPSKIYTIAFALAMVMHRFVLAVPHYRLSQNLSLHGIKLAASTQWQVMADTFKEVTQVITKALMIEASLAHLFYIDDTRQRILAHEREYKRQKEKAKQTGDPPDKQIRKAIYTSVVIAHGLRSVILFLTSTRQAGENLARILENRPDGLSPPLKMSDALAANRVKDHELIEGNCWDHARRKFIECETHLINERRHVVDLINRLYANDRECKNQKMTVAERLMHHQDQSTPVLNQLRDYLEDLVATRKLEPNSSFGKAAAYIKNHWEKLTAFTVHSGMPLSSAEVERAIKTAIPHRKNSLQYATENGANLGDEIMSIVRTCVISGVNPHSYLSTVAAHQAEVIEMPSLWLPWNYLEQIQPQPD